MTDSLQSLKPDNGGESRNKGNPDTAIGFSVFTGIVATTTSYIALSIDLASGKYGGVEPMPLICLGLPAGLFGILGGFAWYKLRKKSKFVPIDLIPLLLIGFVAGMIPFACIKMLSFSM